MKRRFNRKRWIRNSILTIFHIRWNFLHRSLNCVYMFLATEGTIFCLCYLNKHAGSRSSFLDL
uniref:Uncharacterized protein n=1 Tax=Lotus japonicus TaxID=34305 RepID=I3SIW3_LOTJA|nr:unknown [Lotus japonicus]